MQLKVPQYANVWTILGEFQRRKRDISFEHQVSLHQKLTNHGLTCVSPLACVSPVFSEACAMLLGPLPPTQILVPLVSMPHILRGLISLSPTLTRKSTETNPISTLAITCFLQNGLVSSITPLSRSDSGSNLSPCKRLLRAIQQKRVFPLRKQLLITPLKDPPAFFPPPMALRPLTLLYLLHGTCEYLTLYTYCLIYSLFLLELFLAYSGNSIDILVAKSCLTLLQPHGPGSYVHGISQARIPFDIFSR